VSSDRKYFSLHFSDKVGKSLELSVPLREHSNFRIGGNADFFFKASSRKQIVEAVHLAKKCSIPYYIIGGGYNLLFDDMGFRGLIIKNCVKSISRRQREEIEVSSGTSLQDLLLFCVEEGMGGLEFLAGIPGTVGGAVFGNAGAFNQEIGAFLKEALILDDKGNETEVNREYFDFEYRWSSLKKKHNVLLRIVLSLQEKDKDNIKSIIENNLEKRKRKHPPADTACAGSYFKNLVLPSGKKVPAAFYLDQVGAKKLQVGGASVYPGHANFIINRENASSLDVLNLASELKRKVKNNFGIDLKEEVLFLPAVIPNP